ncbi:MAG: hypothetical protein Kow0065_11960 [Methylomicrobium sp.]
MTTELNKTEASILIAIDTWHQHIRPLFDNDQDCPDCPKRFIYGCFCSFERLTIERALDCLVEKGILASLPCTKDSSECCYRKIE